MAQCCNSFQDVHVCGTAPEFATNCCRIMHRSSRLTSRTLSCACVSCLRLAIQQPVLDLRQVRRHGQRDQGTCSFVRGGSATPSKPSPNGLVWQLPRLTCVFVVDELGHLRRLHSLFCCVSHCLQVLLAHEAPIHSALQVVLRPIAAPVVGSLVLLHARQIRLRLQQLTLQTASHVSVSYMR
jgi:hypothetical protein